MWSGRTPRTTWLVLDAHRSIPFQMVQLAVGPTDEPRVAYEAPPRFRAKMTHNGQWGKVGAYFYPAGVNSSLPERYGWKTPPTQYTVSLYDGAVTYTFAAVYDDLPPHAYDQQMLKRRSEEPNVVTPPKFVASTLHDLPLYEAGEDVGWSALWPGWGVPHYGVCVQMKDVRGNSARIHYCGMTRKTLDDLPAGPFPDDGREQTACHECQQMCFRKGQISRVELFAANETSPTWTLLYAHREFAGNPPNKPFKGVSGTWDPNMDPENPNALHPALWGMSAVDSIYAFAGDPFDVSWDDEARADLCLYVPVGTPLHDVDPLAWEPLTDCETPDDLPLPTDWVYRVRYHYDAKPDPEVPALDVPVLLGTTVTTRERDIDGQTGSLTAGVEGTERDREMALRYEHPSYGTNGHQDGRAELPVLTAMYSHEDLARLTARIGSTWAGGHHWQGISASAFRLIQYGSGSDPDLADLSETEAAEVASFASVCWQRQEGEAGAAGTASDEWPTEANPAMPPAGTLMNANISGGSRAYVSTGVPATRLMNDGSGAATRALSVQRGDGTTGHYLIHRMLVLPRAVEYSGAGSPPFWLRWTNPWDSDEDELLQPMRSMFVHPYRWKTYGDDDLDDSPVLSEPRYIAIVDEFASRGEMMDHESIQNYSDTTGLKPGQTARRVLEINAAGYVLRERRWDFSTVDSEGNFAFSSTGIGAEYVYEPLNEVLEDVESELVNLVAPPDANQGGTDEAMAQIEAFTKQLLLTEVRTVGWSQADLDGQGKDEGLIHFYEHEWLDDPETDTESPKRLPWSARVAVRAEGVQQGAGQEADPPNPRDPGPRLYTRQWLRGGEDEAPPGVSPTDVVAEVQFLKASVANELLTSVPAFGSEPEGVSIQRYLTQRYDDGANADLPPNERPVKLLAQVGPGRELLPDSGRYYPFTATYFEPQTGYQTWSAMGMLKSTNPIWGTGSTFDENDPLSTLVITRLYVDPEGRATLTVADFDPGVTTGAFTCPEFIHNGYPDIPRVSSTDPGPGWMRLPASGAAFTDPVEAKTFYGYDGYGLSDILMPNGRRWARRHIWISRPPYDEFGNYTFGTTYPTRLDDFRYEPGSDPGDWTAMPHVPSSGIIDDIHFGGGQFCREFVFPDLQLDSGTNVWTAVSAGEVRDYIGDQPTGELAANRRVQFEGANGGAADVTAFVDATPGAPPGDPESRGPHTQPWFRELARQRMYPNQYGRMERAETFIPDLNGVMAPVGFKDVNDLGEVYRERELDGTITRITRNALGHALRRYVGTIDDAWTTLNGVPDWVPQNNAAQVANNLMLVERTEYGTTPDDVWLPTISRRYDTNQGFEDDWQEYPWQEPPTSDPHGQATITQYDWRRRPVRTDVYDRGDPAQAARLSTSFTFLDHAGRVVMEVQYGPDDGASTLSVPAGHDPSTYTIDDTAIPDPEDFLGASLAGIAPISITVNKMGPDGNIVERRDYLMDSTPASPAWHATLTYTGVGGQPLYQHSPGQAAQHTVLDGLGRTAKTRTILPPSTLTGNNIGIAPELSRTDYEYDLDGNVLRTTTWQRIVPWESGGQAALDATNAVSSTTLNWYDQQRRLVATVDLGATDGSVDPASVGFNSAHAFVGEVDDILWYNPDSPPTLVPLPALAIERAGVPAHFPLTIYHYNLAGQQEYVARQILTSANTDPTIDHYSVTRTTFDGLGNPLRVIENAGGEPGTQRETLNGYVLNRLDSVRQLSTPTDSTGDIPAALSAAEPMFNLDFGATAANDWGAEVVDAGSGTTAAALTSRHGGHVKFMHLPPEYIVQSDPESPGGGPVTPSPHWRGLKFRYDFQGRIVERIDARGISMRYEYDALDRLSKVRVGYYPAFESLAPDFAWSSWTPGYPAQGGSAPTDRVARLEYTYAPDLKTYEVKAFDSSGTRTTHTKLEFNAQGNLIKDWQALGSNIHAGTPRTEYTWDVAAATFEPQTFSFSPGHTRLSTLRYPKAPNVPTRYVEFTYGDADSAADVTSTIARMRSRYGTEPYRPAATFGHIAEGRRAWMTLGDDLLTQGYGLDTASGGTPAGVGLAGLDGLGRLRGLSYVAGPHVAAGSGSPGDDLLVFGYSYDLAGQRTGATRTPRPAGALAADSYESQENGYDALMRLTASTLRHHAGAADVTGDPLQRDEWGLDAWGTWASRVTFSPTADENDDPENEDEWTLEHVPDARAAIAGIARSVEPYSGTPPAPETVAPDHDAAGNLTCDGRYVYQYDAWSRLVQVNLIAEPPFGGGPAVGDSVPGTTRLAGALVKHFTYDGLGRLVRVLSPYPEPGATPPEGWTVAPVRSERLYYDGVRRIQEVYTDPLLALGESAAQGNTNAQGAVGEGQEEEGQTLEGEEGQIESGSGEPGGEDPPGPPPNTFITYLEREYLWGPGDGITGGAGAGLDELIGIFDIDRRAWWTLLDASGDVVAIVDDGAATAHGYGTGSSSTSVARLCAQFCYDAYGQLLTVQGLHPFPDPRTGHKGLHLDRLDAGVADPVTGAAIPRHENGSVHTYFVRNRHYSPELGRCLQRDPNATGLAVAYDGSSMAGSMDGASRSIRLGAHLTDGVSIYGWLRGSPIGGSDAFGLFDLSIVGLLGSSTTVAELQSDWTDTVIDYGMQTGMNVMSMFGQVGWEQADAMDAMLDWNADDNFISVQYGGVDEGATMLPEFSAEESPAEMVMAGAAGASGKKRRREPRHHIIPAFLMGIDGEDNRLPLPPSLHAEYHRLLEREFAAFKPRLNPPNSQGDDNWRARFRSRKGVPPDEVAKIRTALVRSAREFDKKTGGKYGLQARVQQGLAQAHYAAGALDAKKKVRRIKRR
jgi:YD repeat-containing protein